FQNIKKKFPLYPKYFIYDKLVPDLGHQLALEAVQNPEILSAVLGVMPKLKVNTILNKQWIFLRFYLNEFPSDIKTPKIDDFALEQAVAKEQFTKADLTKDWLKEHPLILPPLLKSFFTDLIYNSKIWASSATIFEVIKEHQEMEVVDKYFSENPGAIFNYGLSLCLQGKPWKNDLVSRLEHHYQDLMSGFEAFLQGNFSQSFKTLVPFAKDWGKKSGMRQGYFIPDILGIALYIARFLTDTDSRTFVDDCRYIVNNVYSNDEKIGYMALRDIYLKKYSSGYSVNYEQYFHNFAFSNQASVLAKILPHYICFKENKRP
ncbi:MAG: hypothetical protein IJU40_02665, partial [Desulfovibrionaceae bacterium]|nr:hypothetical protein [Desulfovibrionaceae bacterium]